MTLSYKSAKPLNNHFNNIKKALEAYLSDVLKNYKADSVFINKIEAKIFSEFKYEDVVRAGTFITKKHKYLLLNFNYTDICKHYCTTNDTEIINIHGQLNDDKNPIIFGYGDELGEEYMKLENLNDNEYLENIKSIKYLETDNYKNLMNFISSDKYQILIMGHSCGNSDRTLLNTLFEHENCISIKPYYHKRNDGTDNYSDIVRNISRNFNNKITMRDKVVNKLYCEPLVEL